MIVALSGEAAKAGPIWFAVVLILCIACYFLFKSMSKHLRIVREQFPVEPPKVDAPPPEVPATEVSRSAEDLGPTGGQ